MKKPTFSAIATLLFGPILLAYDEDRAKENFSSELVICAAYYQIAAEGVRRTGQHEKYEELMRVADFLLQNARKYNIDETVLARHKLALENHANLIHKDYSNLSILTVKYRDICEQVTEEPEERLNFWRQMKD